MISQVIKARIIFYIKYFQFDSYRFNSVEILLRNINYFFNNSYNEKSVKRSLNGQKLTIKWKR